MNFNSAAAAADVAAAGARMKQVLARIPANWPSSADRPLNGIEATVPRARGSAQMSLRRGFFFFFELCGSNRGRAFRPARIRFAARRAK